ncbi:MAG: hypothetical protein AB7O21_11875 [Gammaproteobacteria bacterium]
MEILDILLNSRVVMAVVLFGILAGAEPFLEQRIARHFAGNPPALWAWEHVGLPLLRAALVLGFVYLAYPALFGLREAPGLGLLLAAEEARTSTVLGVLYLLALLAPVIPLFYAHPEFVLPLQGILATAFLFKWMTAYLHINTVSLWPGSDLAAAIVLTAYLAHRIGRRLGQRVGSSIDALHDRHGFDALATHVLTLQAQLPVIVIYATGLARQIAI